MEKCIVYIGDFDFRNENVQSHLVRNNGIIFSDLGYKTAYIGMNRDVTSFDGLKGLPEIGLREHEIYYELPNTLNMSGLLKCSEVCKKIIRILDELKGKFSIEYVITYQSPTYAVAVKKTAKWAKKHGVKYIVNCADLPVFDAQPSLKKTVMKSNWKKLHRINNKYADGIIAVSSYIDSFFKKEGRPSVVIPPLFDTLKCSFEGELNDVPSFVYAGVPFIITGSEVPVSGMKDRLDYIIDLFIRLSENEIPYKFTVVGITKEDYLSCVPRHGKLSEDDGSIVFLGRKSHDETLSIIKKADFSINYRDENLMTKAGFSTKIVESTSVGTPVVINDTGDTFSYLENGSDAFMLSGDVDTDVSELKKMCSLTADERLETKRSLYNKRIFDINNYNEAVFTFLKSVKGDLNE